MAVELTSMAGATFLAKTEILTRAADGFMALPWASTRHVVNLLRV